MNKRSLTFLKIILSTFLVFLFGISALSTAGYVPNRYLFAFLGFCLTSLFFLALKKPIRFLYLGGGLLLAGLIYFGIILKFDIQGFNEEISGFFSWLPMYLSGNREFDLNYGFIFGGLLFILISGLVVFSEKWVWTQFVVLIGGTFYFGYMWFNYIEAARTFALLFMTVGICRFGLISYEEKIKKLEQKGYIIEENVYKGFIITILLIATFTFGVANSVKLSVEPVYWEALSEKTVEAFPFIVNLKNEFEESRDYGYYNGYENNGGIGHGKRFGEPIKLSDRPVLEVNTDYKKTLYLRGSVYDLYSESGWKTGAGTETHYKDDESIEKYNKNRISTYEDTKLSVKHIGILSSSGFTPYDTTKITGAKADIFMDERKRIFFSKIIPKNSGYSIYAKIPVVNVNIEKERLSENILSATEDASTDEIKKTSRLLTFKDQLHFSSHNVYDGLGKTEEYEVRDGFAQSEIFYDEINSMKYYALPKGYSEKVKELTLSIIKDIKSPTENTAITHNGKEELLKITAIAEYLRSHYEYTLTPPVRPSGVELTDFFLFESKKGYCVHFATSMTLLLRAAGIPARYVEGFVSEYKGESKRIVAANKAHAWVEVYVADLGGWFTFEPTPIISDIIPSQKVDQEFVKAEDSAAIEGGQSNQGNKGLTISKNPRLNRVDEEDRGSGAGNTNGEKGLLSKLLRAALLVALGLIVLLLLYRVLINIVLPKIKIRRLMGTSTDKKLDIYLELLSYYGTFLGVSRKKNLTMNEFLNDLKESIKEMERIKDREGLISRLDSSNEYFSKARYGNTELEAEEVSLMMKTLKELEYAGVCRLGKITSLRRRLQKLDFKN